MLLLALLGCPAPDTGKPADSAEDTGTPTDTDTGTPAADEDGDGYKADVDCDDNNYQTYPDAPELCDGADNDCDGGTDEDFDADGDGALDATACTDGTDCNDSDSSIYGGAVEVPYDDIDQDCDGEDLVDADGDGYPYQVDCDDTDATVNPGATEIPKDWIDQDCDGEDLQDVDGDGYNDAGWGGDDCDDADASVNPGATDTWNDGVDSDCDGVDGGADKIKDAPVIISGTPGTTALLGQDVTTCDLDGDTLPDLVVTAPFSDSYNGQIGIFYGDGASSWTDGMEITDADTLFTGRRLFLGFDVACGDFDGDGNDDLVTGRGEIQYVSPYLTTFEVLVWYGDGGRFSRDMSDAEADAHFELELGVEDGATSVYNRDFTLADIDGDHAAELILANASDPSLSAADDRFYIVGGGRYSGELQLADEASAVVSGEGISVAVQLPDIDGDGMSEVFFGESGLGGEWDSGDTGTVYVPGAGRASLVMGEDVATGDLGDLAYGFWEGEGGGQLGWAAAGGDFDGDGNEDLAVVNVNDETVATGGGAIYVFSPIEGAGALADADASVIGQNEYGFFGYRMIPVGDQNGDGAVDLAVSELYGSDTRGRIWLLDGAAIGGGSAPEEATLAAWDGELELEALGIGLAAADFDADGYDDIVVGAYTYSDDGSNYNGRVYVLLSGS